MTLAGSIAPLSISASVGRYISGELSPKEQKFGRLFARRFDEDLSPEGLKFGEHLLKFLDGTLPPEEFGRFEKELREDLGAFQQQLREHPKGMAEFGDTLLLDLHLSDIAREKRVPRPRPNLARPAENRPRRVR